MKVEWACDGCKSVIRFADNETPWNSFAQGVIVGLLLTNHRKKCQGNHYENGNTAVPSFEVALLGAVEGKTWKAIQKASAAKAGVGR